MTEPEKLGATEVTPTTNISVNLERMSPVQLEHQDEIIRLHRRITDIAERERRSPLNIQPGGHWESVVSVIHTEGDTKYEVRAFASRPYQGVDEESSLLTGLRFYYAERPERPLPTELTIFPQGIMSVASDDNESLLGEDVALAEKLIKQLNNDAHYIKTPAAKRRARLRTVGIAALACGTFAFTPVASFFTDHILRINDPERFDGEGFTLAGGRTSFAGETVEPEFSLDLLNDDRLTVHEIPQVTEARDPGSPDSGTVYSDQDATISVSDGLRQIIFTSSSDDDCKLIKVRHGTPREVRSWTDYIYSDGTPVEGELTIRLNRPEESGSTPSITACWHGKEASDYDDPRIVFEIE